MHMQESWLKPKNVLCMRGTFFVEKKSDWNSLPSQVGVKLKGLDNLTSAPCTQITEMGNYISEPLPFLASHCQ